MSQYGATTQRAQDPQDALMGSDEGSVNEEMVVNSQIDIEINTKNVCRYLGYLAHRQPMARVSSLVEEYAEEAYHLIDPLYSYVVRDVELVLDSHSFVEGSDNLLSRLIVFESEVVARLLNECCRVGVFAVTIGGHLEDMVNQLVEDGLMLQAFVLDAIGSDAVEKVADFVEGVIQEKASADGLVTSRRFSPGYCDWDLSQQGSVFRAVRGDSIGIYLTESYLMIPQKSITGIIGIGPLDGNVRGYNPCNTCNKCDCPGRR